MAYGDSEVTFNPGATEKPRMSEISQDMSLGLEARISEEAQGSGDSHRQSTTEREVDVEVSMIASTPRSIPFVPPKMVLKPEKFEGKSDLGEYISHFQDCAELGGWDDRSKCLVLAANLRGAARKYYDGLPQEDKKDYDSLLTALRRRFGGGHLQDSWMTKLEMRRRKQGESVSDLGDDIWRMTQRAYHDFDLRSQEQLALKHFYRVVDAEMKVKCVENKCRNIYDAVAVVERYEALYEGKQEGRKSHVRAVEVSTSNTLAQQLDDIKNQLQTLNTRQTRTERAVNRDNDMRYNPVPPRGRQVVCYRCGETGHVKTQCTAPQDMSRVTCFHCGKPGHYRYQCTETGSTQTRVPGNVSLSNWRAGVWWEMTSPLTRTH